MKLFKGQVVHVKGTVVEPEPDCDDEITVQFEGRTYPDYVRLQNIVHAEPVQLAVGDLVMWKGTNNKYTILHIDGGVAFLKWDDGSGLHSTHDVSDLRRAD